MKQHYVNRNFTPASLALIEVIDDICTDYMHQGYTLTVRQLYYQLVSRNIIPNTERSYKNTTSLVNDARLAGLIDWEAIEDRTREFMSRPRWENGKGFLASVMPQFHADLWEGQEIRVFCIVEKDALVGVLQRACRQMDVPLLAARGYPSISVLREFAINDIIPRMCGQKIEILHLGDHDPSGIDMSRDLVDRLSILCESDEAFELSRIALNMDQIEENRCPPNPAKLTDSRVGAYIRKYGTESWELDALEPSYLDSLVRGEITARIDPEVWAERTDWVTETRERLEKLADEFPE